MFRVKKFLKMSLMKCGLLSFLQSKIDPMEVIANLSLTVYGPEIRGASGPE
jgi:hypothetical protein